MKIKIEDPIDLGIKVALAGVAALMAGYVTWHLNNPSAFYDWLYG